MFAQIVSHHDAEFSIGTLHFVQLEVVEFENVFHFDFGRAVEVGWISNRNGPYVGNVLAKKKFQVIKRILRFGMVTSAEITL